MNDVVNLLRALIRCPSITPVDAGAMDIVQNELARLGFVCERMVFGSGKNETQNLYAKKGTGEPHFCFLGHTDVVPAAGQKWDYPPFGAEIHDGRIYGRGAMDMKSGIACFIKALEDFSFNGTISLLITGNEEDIPTYGTPAVLKELEKRGEKWTAAIVGEPGGTQKTGAVIKTGRRGSLNARLTVKGKSGHTGYTQLAVNPVEALCDILTEIRRPLDNGTPDFEPSTLSVTTIDVGNPTPNVIPAEAFAKFNCRFNDLHTVESLTELLRARTDAAAKKAGVSYDLETECMADVFICKDRRLPELVKQAVKEITGINTVESTDGGSSDARFMVKHCPVLECGVSGQGMHGANESVAIADLAVQVGIYRRILEKFFN